MRTIGSFKWIPANNRLHLSDDAWRLFDLPKEGVATFERIFRNAYPGDKSEIKRTLEKSASECVGFDFEWRFLTSDNQIRTIRVAAQPLSTDHGEVELIGTMTQVMAPISPMITLDDELTKVKDEAARFRLTIDQAPGLMWSAHADGWADYLSLRWLEYAGLTLEEAMGWGWQQAIHPDDSPALMEAWAVALANGTPGDVKARLRRHDGVYRWFSFRANPYFDDSGKLVRWYGQTFDIEDLRSTEALLAGEKRLLQMLAMSASLKATLEEACKTVDELLPCSTSSIWLLCPEGNTVTDFFAPGLPQAFIDDLKKLIDETGNGKIGFYAGPCGSAIQSKKTIVIPDLANSDGWVEYRELAVSYGFRSVLCAPIFSSAGKTVGMFVHQSREVGELGEHPRTVVEHFTNMTAMAIEHMSMDKALLASEERFRLMAETTPDVIWITDLHPEKVLYCSPRFEDLWGYKLEELYRDARYWLHGIHPEDRSKVIAAFNRLVEDKDDSPYAIEFRLLREDGEIRWIYERAVLIRDANGAPQRVNGVSTDITDRKLTEQALAKSESRLALAIAASSDGIWDWDVVTSQVYMSPRTREIYSLDSDKEILSRSQWRALIRYHPDDRIVVDKWLQDCLDGHITSFTCEVRVQTFTNAYRWIRIRGMANQDQFGRAYRIAGAVTDIDTQRRTEMSLQQAKRLEAMGTLAGGIAHDFNNILGVVLGYGEMALRAASTGTRLHRDLDNIVSAGERGRALVDRILAFSRSAPNENISVNVEAVVEEALGMVRPTLPNGINVVSYLRAGKAALCGDPTQVHQIVMNLLTNAIQAMPNGGVINVTLNVQVITEPKITATSVVEPGAYLVLSVEDNGTGMPPEVLEKIFDPFFTTKEVGVGTGLGLSLVHGIAIALGGAVDVFSQVGKGSNFTVYLPQTGFATLTRNDVAASLPKGSKERVLVVDDEAALAQLTGDSLTELNYEATVFTSSSSALQAFNAEPDKFDAIVTDERMSGLSGLMLIKAARELRPEIPSLLMTGFVGDIQVRTKDEHSPNEFLKKPVTMRELALAMERMLLDAP